MTSPSERVAAGTRVAAPGLVSPPFLAACGAFVVSALLLVAPGSWLTWVPGWALGGPAVTLLVATHRRRAIAASAGTGVLLHRLSTPLSAAVAALGFVSSITHAVFFALEYS